MYIVDEDRASGDICGYAGLWFDSDDAQIMTLGVSKKYQRQHRGQRLLDELCRAAAGFGAGRMLLEVRVDNGPAVSLYKKNGFELMGIRRRYYQPEDIDAYTMARTVAEGRKGDFQEDHHE